MALLLSSDALRARRAVVGGPLAPLADSLARDLVPVLDASADGIWLPTEKAQLTGAGGVCPRDGMRLLFDPFRPRAHRCPRCGHVYDEEAHYRWWIMGYQLWLAERAVHAATLHALGAGEGGASARLGDFATRVLVACADAYLTYPNADNVLGPTRPFFSTYLESLWLLHLCVALDLLETSGALRSHVSDRVRERVIEPSAALIASYDEGWSNRQVWHVAALIAAARLLRCPQLAARAVHGAHGLLALMDEALLADGTWYEGENYHQFAHRGFWYALAMTDRTNDEVPDATRARFVLGFAAPFRVALPDLSLPSRRDSQYAVSLRQWRWAEWCELGLFHAPNEPTIAGTLAALYAPGPPRLDVGRWRATGESERNEPASALTRADLGWKSLLFAAPTLSDAAPMLAESVLEVRQGFAVFRRDRGRLWVGVDYGASGGGHGHADRLNLTIADGGVRWLDDMGTGTYVERTLHWYRSTLAHQAPLADGASQPRRDGELLAFDEDGTLGIGWIDAIAQIGAHVTARRSVVVCDGYVVDLLRWTAACPVTLDLPIHLAGSIDGVGPFAPKDPGSAAGLEDGFDFLRDVAASTCAAGTWATLRATAGMRDSGVLRGWVRSDSPSADGPTTWFRAVAPGPPGTGDQPFYFVRQQGSEGSIVTVWDLRRVVRSVDALGAAIVVHRHEGGADAHTPHAHGWRVERTSADPTRAANVVELGGANARTSSPATPRGPSARQGTPAREFVLPRGPNALRWTLARLDYVWSEVEWEHAGRPTATVSLTCTSDALVVTVDVQLGRMPHFIAAETVNVLDNERADVNSDGVQLLIVPDGTDAVPLAWLLVPEHDGSVRVTATTPSAGTTRWLHASWHRRGDGFTLACTLPLAAVVPNGAGEAAFRFDVAVNECPPGRDRRRGQLCLSGADGGRVYLRGDRMDAARALVIRLPRP